MNLNVWLCSACGSGTDMQAGLLASISGALAFIDFDGVSVVYRIISYTSASTDYGSVSSADMHVSRHDFAAHKLFSRQVASMWEQGCVL